MTNLDSILKSVVKKGLSSQGYGFPGCESWTVKTAEH